MKFSSYSELRKTREEIKIIDACYDILDKSGAEKTLKLLLDTIELKIKDQIYLINCIENSEDKLFLFSHKKHLREFYLLKDLVNKCLVDFEHSKESHE